MDTRTYQQILQARRAEWEALHRTGRRRRAEAARARSAARWADDVDRPGQEVRAARLRLIPGLPPGTAADAPSQQSPLPFPGLGGPADHGGTRPTGPAGPADRGSARPTGPAGPGGPADHGGARPTGPAGLSGPAAGGARPNQRPAFSAPVSPRSSRRSGQQPAAGGPPPDRGGRRPGGHPALGAPPLPSPSDGPPAVS